MLSLEQCESRGSISVNQMAIPSGSVRNWAV